MPVDRAFADYCCELLSCIGEPVVKRMFGGFAVYVDGLSIAWIIDLSPPGTGDNTKLYLKASPETRATYEAAGCERFAYEAKGVTKLVDYYSAPDAAMESPNEMLPWARIAMGCALRARKKKPRR